MKKGKKKTIGFLTFDISGTYNYSMWKHISEAARSKDVNLISFCGGILFGENDLHRHWNRVYDLASAESVDGLIILSASIAQKCGTENLNRFLRRYKDLPKISISLNLPGIPWVGINNTEGMEKLIRHMVEFHGIAQPLFLGGTEHNDEARERLSVFRKILTENNIEINERLIKSADFRYDLAYQITEEILQEGIPFDSVIAANDDMALAALEVLQKKGIGVPEQVIISGFDNTESSGVGPVPLSTVHQPLETLAEEAVERMLKLISGEDVSDSCLLPTREIVRKSCGCLSTGLMSYGDFEIIKESPETTPLPDNNFFDQDPLSKIIKDLPPGTFNEKTQLKLWDLYRNSLDGGSLSPTLLYWNRILHRCKSESCSRSWHNLLTAWKARIDPHLKQEGKNLTASEDFFLNARILINQWEKSTQSNRQIERQQKDFLFILFSSYFSPILNLDSFLDYISSRLPNFGVIGTYVALFGKEDQQKSRMLMYFSPGGNTYWDKDGIEIRSTSIIPDDIEIGENYNIIVEPLLNYEDIIGYLVFQVESAFDIVENIRQIVSNALVSLLMVQEILKDKQLKILLHDLETKQHELEQAYKSLKENQDHMLIIEKMASLGQMTAGIAHEMNTPIAAVRASLNEIETLISEYEKSIDDPDVSAEDHRGIAEDLKHSAELAKKASEKAAAFVRGIKSQTRDLSPKERFRFNAVNTINEALLLLSHNLKHSGINVDFKPDTPYIELFGTPGRLSQVVTNLVNNAIEACRETENGRIELDLTVEESKIVLQMKDNGSGIKEENINRIFDPMFTTKPFGVGTGLGLTLVHDIVYGEFEGLIDVESSPEKGTCFTIIFPRPLEEPRG